MQLNELIQSLPISPQSLDQPCEISGITYDSRKVNPGDLFIAITGHHSDGNQFIDQAIAKGAVAILTDAEKKRSFSATIPILQTPQVRNVLPSLSARFFRFPTRDLKVVGITGTNGKTTSSYLIEAILRQAGYSPALVGTIEYRHGDHHTPASHTTPESLDLDAWLSSRKPFGVDSLVMEVSSHALDQKRVGAVQFDVALFTNLTQDHLDYHLDLEAYFYAKRRLFDELLYQSEKKDKCAVINDEDAYGKRLIQNMQAHPVFSFSTQLHAVEASIFPLELELNIHGIHMLVKTPWEVIELSSPLLGRFNASNLLGALGVGRSLKIESSVIQTALAQLKAIPGRLERVQNSKGIHIFVDYAHTPDALEKVLSTLRNLRPSHSKQKLWVIFGCGGDRDTKKRPLMGQIAAIGADQVTVTSDNPRSENPLEIIRAIVPGLRQKNRTENRDFFIEVDRQKAIEETLQKAKPGDIVLIAGKGHENYQILGDTRIHFDDREIAQNWLR